MEAPWTTALSQLPKNKRIPSFFFAHGSPLLLYPHKIPPQMQGAATIGGPDGQNYKFLKYFGKFLLKEYNPKAIVVFSAHWEASNEIQVMDYEKNHLFYDYYGFPPEMYKITFESKGSSTIASRVVELLRENKISAKTITKGRGLDHGVFVPFKVMFPDPFPIPIVEVSMNDNLDPETHIKIGKALSPLRDEEVLILSGGLTIHTFQEMNAWDPSTAPEGFKDFEKEIVKSIESTSNGEERNKALKGVTNHPFYRRAHPSTEHFMPIYVAAGAGSEGSASVIGKLHGALSIAFGL